MEAHAYTPMTPDPSLASSTRSFAKTTTTLSLRGETTSVKSINSVGSLGRETTPKSVDVNRNGTLSRVNTSVTTPKPRRLKKPSTFYPLDYGRYMRDMEQWDNMYFRRASGRHTWIRSESIPSRAVMLDIGCGYGTWAIMTARENPDCRIFGFDSSQIQPDLKRVGLRDVAERITWVHGDMLKPLPFPDCHFDVVRANFIEFCVPEDKWGDLFQEVDRVLKPGGTFETSQGDLIIPCPRFAPRESPPNSQQSRTGAGSTKTRASDELANADPRDHSKLKAAFIAMLEVRFLNPKIPTIIPFFMNLHFTNVLMTPTLRVMLPPSTFVRSQDEAPDGKAAEPQTGMDQHDSTPFKFQMEQNNVSSEMVISQGGQMHLTHTMNSVLACKEAIWEQFQVLNPGLTRPDFDGLLRNWELDMRDRVDMRGTLNAGLGWKIPVDGDREDGHRKIWRETMLQLHASEGLWDAQPLPETCRTIRAFTGVKPRK